MTQKSLPLTILVTGATGFVGTKLCEGLNTAGYVVHRALRHPGRYDGVVVGSIAPDTDWSTALAGVDCVIHLAGLVHLNTPGKAIHLSDYRRVNVEATLNLARQAASTGVKRFIYMSSIKVNGDVTEPGKPINADSPAQPKDPYAISKWEAEQGLLKLSAVSNMEIVCIRPPLIYGLGVKANFLNMMRWLHKGIPLPFGAIHNKRSLVGLDNLIDLIMTCIEHPAAVNQVFLVSDDQDLSTTELLQRTAIAMGNTPRLMPVPQAILEQGLKLLGRNDLARRLCGSLQVDIKKTRDLLGWSPPVSVDEGLKKTTDEFLHSI